MLKYGATVEFAHLKRYLVESGGRKKYIRRLKPLEMPAEEARTKIKSSLIFRLSMSISINVSLIDEAILIVKYIPQVLKAPFIDRLNGLQQGVLSEVASAVKEERCYVLDAEDFLEKLREQKMRILFRELRKAKQCEITKWMRNKFPAGSTGRF